MGVRTDRRRFLQLAGLGAAAVPLAGLPRVGRARGAGERFAVQELAPGVQCIAGPGGNSVVVETADGLALIDGGLKADARDLLKRVQSGKRRVGLLFNTHWHPSATGCNETLGKAGVRIVAQENTRLWLQRPIVKVLENERHEALPKTAWPTETFLDRRQVDLGGTTFECGQLFQAHT
ncbi:MAG: MBL fold metallo-hydrolase, partial [Proteobacteria bacterium]